MTKFSVHRRQGKGLPWLTISFFIYLFLCCMRCCLPFWVVASAIWVKMRTFLYFFYDKNWAPEMVSTSVARKRRV